MPKLIFCFEKKIINLKGKERQIFSICWVTSQMPVTTGALEEGLGALGQDWASSGRSAIQAGAPTAVLVEVTVTWPALLFP